MLAVHVAAQPDDNSQLLRPWLTVPSLLLKLTSFRKRQSPHAVTLKRESHMATEVAHYTYHHKPNN